MLTNLHVKNIALIDEAEVEFDKGLNILTGETGAGKSILLGSVNLALGKKMTSDSIGKFGDHALVEMIFTVENPKIEEALREMDVTLEDGQVILSRKIMEGRSISRINGETCTVAQMKAAASLLLDIHGQHEHQSLLYNDKQLEILDAFGGEHIQNAKSIVETEYHEYERLKRDLKACSLDEDKRQREIDFLQFEIQEIEDANLKEGEDEELEKQFRLMSNSRTITNILESVYYSIGYNDRQAAGEVIGRAAGELSSLKGMNEEIDGIYSQLLDIESMLNDLNREISSCLDHMTFSEEEYDEISKRLDELNRLKGKYGNSIEKVLTYKAKQQEKLDEYLHMEERQEELRQLLEKSEGRLEEACTDLHVLRSNAAKNLELAIISSLQELNFLQVKFEIEIKKLSQFTKNGNDIVSFMISTNPGEPLRSLEKVVSGGELSRIMLAVKALMADKDDKEVLIFDEIDTGISGRTAQKVSEKMAAIAKQRQVLCITHLPQIAAMADTHFEIQKQVTDAYTTTSIKKLDETASVNEIARILGGTEVTERVFESAREMKEMAQVVKNTRLKN